MLYLPHELGEITKDRLVDWSDYNAIKTNSDSCVIKEYPQLPFKIECANTQLEQPIATTDMQFIQHRNAYIHGYLCHPLKDVFSHNRAEFFAKSSGGAGHSERNNQFPTRRDDVGYDRWNEKLQS